MTIDDAIGAAGESKFTCTSTELHNVVHGTV
jgi:hypothetical protein